MSSISAPTGGKPRLRHRILLGSLRALLRTPLALPTERALVHAGHAFPRRLASRGALVHALAERHRGRELVARTDFGSLLSVPSTAEGAGYYLLGSMNEPETQSLLRRALYPGDVFVDVGANVGYYTLLGAARCGPAGRVLAFEAQEQLVRHLKRSLALNGVEEHASVTYAAVTDRHGVDVPFFLAQDRDASGIPSLLAHAWLDVEEPVLVPAVTLDAALAAVDGSAVDVMKIDIEGAELQALHGMSSLLEAGSPGLLVLEVLPTSLAFSSIQDGRTLQAGEGAARAHDVVELLSRYGLEPRRILPDGRLGAPYTVSELARVTWSTNVGFVREEFLAARPELTGGTGNR